MNSQPQPATVAAGDRKTPLMDLLIRIALIFALGWACYQVLSPFLSLMVWSIILAVTLYPVHRRTARLVGGKQWAASLILAVTGFLLIITPTALLMNSFADSVRGFVTAVQENTLQIPVPSENVKGLPLVGEQLYETWTKAHADLPAFVQSVQPKIGELAGFALRTVASAGSTVILFIASFIVACILMAYGGSGWRTTQALFRRVAGETKGEALANLSVATIRTVALGVIGIAAIQAILVGLSLLAAGVPAAGVLAIIVLVLAIAQIPALLVTIPAIVYIWMSGDHGTGSAILFTILLLVAGLADNVLKPLLLGRGVDAPMPVILLGALGGMASGGILGMFVGAVALTLGYEIFMAWLSDGVESPKAEVVPIEPSPAVAMSPRVAS
jgi:predicted PurR-regulated permease PerM